MVIIMQEQESITEKRMLEYTEQYMEKVFYFCLKKTGSAYEAEDLTSDISLCVFTQLRRSVSPESFSAWVWQIARNRYSKWAQAKHRRTENISNADICDIELADPDNFVNEFVMSEELSLLRRELAFISADYRNVIVAYYIDNTPVCNIAAHLHISTDAVKKRLFRARKILKEGMDMAREFGKRSYNPERIYFCSSGNQPSGLPFSAVQRKAPINILCAANNNPSSAEELSMELGIALPYMEEEIELLVKGELLSKLENGKYLTSFFISPKECQTEINAICCDYSLKYYEAIWRLAGIALDAGRPLGIFNGTVSESDAHMYFAFMIEQQLENSMFEKKIYGKFKRKDGGNWGFIGWEQGSEEKLPQQFFNNNCSMCNGKTNGSVRTNGYCANNKKFGICIYPHDCISYELLLVFDALDVSNGNISGLSANDKRLLDNAIEVGFATKKDDGSVVPVMLVFRDDTLEKIWKKIKAAPEYTLLFDEMKKLTSNAKSIVTRYSVPYLKDDFDYYVYMSLTDLRSTAAVLWRDKGLYTGGNCQFVGLYFNS